MLCCRGFASRKFRFLAMLQNRNSRNLLTCSVNFSKQFQEKENEHAFTILEKSSSIKAVNNPSNSRTSPAPAVSGSDNFNSSILNGLLNLTDVPVEELHDRFSLITSSIKNSQVNIEDPRFDSLVENIVKALPEMTDSQIADLLKALNDWPPTASLRTPNFFTLWNALDLQCSSRCEKWKHEQLFNIAYLWFQLKFSRVGTYNSKMIAILGNEINIISSQMVVQLMFFINLQRIKMPVNLAAEIENRIMNDMEHLTIDELGVVALGFFKSQTPMKSEKLLIAIVSKIVTHQDEISDMTLAALLKLIRYNVTFETVKTCRELQRTFIPNIYNFQPSTITHLILLVAHHLVCDDELLMKVVCKFSMDMHSVRLKELSKSLYCVAIFKSFKPFKQAIFLDYRNQVVEELRLAERQKEIENYPVSFVSLILSLAYMGIFPEDLINKCFGEDFIAIAQHPSQNIDISRELTVIDTSVEIECPSYKGNRLPSSAKFKNNRKEAVTKSQQDRMLEDICENAMDIFGISERNYFQICHILPHFQIPDVLFIMDENGILLPIPPVVKLSRRNIIRPNTKDKWFAVVGGGRSFYQRDHRQVTGASEMKLRQLKKLGYHVVEIPWFTYNSLHKGLKEKYMKKKISERL